jgi:hypothetical protein
VRRNPHCGERERERVPRLIEGRDIERNKAILLAPRIGSVKKKSTRLSFHRVILLVPTIRLQQVIAIEAFEPTVVVSTGVQWKFANSLNLSVWIYQFKPVSSVRFSPTRQQEANTVEVHDN